MCVVGKDENKQKEAEIGPFFKKHLIWSFVSAKVMLKDKK